MVRFLKRLLARVQTRLTHVTVSTGETRDDRAKLRQVPAPSVYCDTYLKPSHLRTSPVGARSGEALGYEPDYNRHNLTPHRFPYDGLSTP